MTNDLTLSGSEFRPVAPRTTVRSRLDRLTSLRFFAAFLVVAHHTFRDLVVVPGLSGSLAMGTVGVSFFFVLSGFVLTWSSRPDDSTKAFYRRRFARVYPMHFLMFVLAVPALIFIGQEVSLPELLPNLLVIQAWVPDIGVYFGGNAPSWSLACEAFFYLMFPVIAGRIIGLDLRALTKSLVGIVLLVFAISFAVSLLSSHDIAGYFLYVFPPFRILEFVAGCLLARIVIVGFSFHISLLWSTVFAAIVYALLLVAHYKFTWIGHGIENAVLLPFILAIIAAAATSDLQCKGGFLTSRWAVRLGEWSFALYMTHWVLLQMFAHLDSGANSRPVPIRLFEGLVFVAVAIGLSGVAYNWVERPLEKRLRGANSRSETVTAER